MAENNIKIGGRLHAITVEGVVAGADEILDDIKQQKQSEINAEVDASIAELREGLADAGKVDDVKVNGVSVLDSETKEANINITASVVENDTPGNPIASATMQDGNVNIKFEHVKGEQGIQGIQGIQGLKGDSAVFDRDDPNTPVFVMANNMGASTVKSMTQKAVTEAIVNGTISEWEHVATPSHVTSLIYNGGGSVVAGSSDAITYYMQVNAGESYKIAVTGNTATNAGAGIGLSQKEVPASGDTATLITDAMKTASFEVIVSINESGYLWIGVRGSSLTLDISSPKYVKEYVTEQVTEAKEKAAEAKEIAEAQEGDVTGMKDAIGYAEDNTNLLDPSEDIKGNSFDKYGSLTPNVQWDTCPMSVEPGGKYYFYVNGSLSDLNSNKRAIDKNREIIATSDNHQNYIEIPSDAEAPITLYVNHRSENATQGTPIDVNDIMVSTNGNLSSHHAYGAKEYGSNLPKVDEIDHMPALADNPLASIISHPSRARVFPIWGVIGGSFETGYTNGKRRDNNNAATFYDNEGGTATPGNGWGYEWPTLFGNINGVEVGDYAIEGHSFYRWLQKVKSTNPTNFGNDGKHAQAFIINMSGNEIGSRGSASGDKYPAGLQYGDPSEIDWNNDYTDYSLEDDGSATYFLDEMTYCEMIAAMVQLIWKIEPECHIFFATLRKESTRSIVNKQKADDMVSAFKGMQSITPSSHLIDMYEYGMDWSNATARSRYIAGSHPTRLGHIYLADAFNTYVDWLIGKSPESVSDAAYIGTVYQHP